MRNIQITNRIFVEWFFVEKINSFVEFFLEVYIFCSNGNHYLWWCLHFIWLSYSYILHFASFPNFIFCNVMCECYCHHRWTAFFQCKNSKFCCKIRQNKNIVVMNMNTHTHRHHQKSNNIILQWRNIYWCKYAVSTNCFNAILFMILL